ncbi:MAG: hypothetical protein PVI06_07470 [Desulfobacterales bacterium]|jgi:hypothetical protein
MPVKQLTVLRLSDRDLDFLVGAAAPEVRDKSSLKNIIRQDDDFCRSFIADEKVFRRLMGDDEIVLKISPVLFFEILLRNAAKELERLSYTLEKTRAMSIPVFDTRDLVELLNEKSVVVYLADMLSSFTRIESYTFTFRIREGIWKKIRFNDMDIISLIRFSEVLEGDYRLGLYKRIADICLFILGIFPDFAEDNYRYPLSGEIRPPIAGRARISPEEYEKKGRQFYRLAAEHRAAVESELSDVFWILHKNFEKAKKPLNFISDYYLRTKRQMLFA